MFEEVSTKYTPLLSLGSLPLLIALATWVRTPESLRLVVLLTIVLPEKLTFPLTLPVVSPYVVLTFSIFEPPMVPRKCSIRLLVAAVFDPVLAQLPYQMTYVWTGLPLITGSLW